ncbi:MAG: NADH:flavin oxidoreductase [SAR324 cluster bacterium]|nr:NADH:flavin oxidoreductase [SAR324 cluster bacterium]
MSSTDPLLQPFQLKHLSLKNRIMRTSHEPAYSEDGLPKERYRLYHEEKAKGGIALTMFGGSTLVAQDSPPVFGNLYAGNDEIIPYFQKMAEGVHRHDAALMCQITHLGRRSVSNAGDWLPIVAPSCVREPAHRGFPKIAEGTDIHRIVKAYGAAARRCQEGGLDGVEIEAYGHLLDAFWSPRTNLRTDSYGGSLENRARFALEVLEEIRKQVGSAYIVGIRMVFDEALDSHLDGGLRLEEGLKIGEMLVKTGGLDFINVIQGHVDTQEGLSHIIPNMGTPAGPQLEFAGAVKREFELPVFHAARINEVATARHALREDLLDMVGMTRAHMADPYIVTKIESGEEERIRPCVGMGYCLDRLYENGDALCAHNAATGREQTMPHRVPKTSGSVKKIVVIGAGPSGLEAARVCAERGHKVVLFEANDRAGGQLLLAAKVERRRETISIADWLFAEVQRLGVEVRFNFYAEVSDVLAENPEVVIVAAGGLPNIEFLRDGADLVIPSWDILAGTVKAEKNILLFDDNGQHPGISCAEFLANSETKLEYVTPERIIAPDVGGTNYPAYLRALHLNEVKITLNHRLTEVHRNDSGLTAVLYNEYTHANIERSVEQIVVEHGTLPLDELYLGLREKSSNGGELDLEALISGKPQNIICNPESNFKLFRVGDAVASRNIHSAIYDSLRLCKDL